MPGLRIVYPTCCGLDVHKSFVYACIASTDAHGVTTYRSDRFSTFPKGLRSLADWLAANNCRDVCMESTGKYWFPVHDALESTCNVVVSHPKFVKAIKGKKTDKKDAQWIANLFKHDLVRGSFIPPPDIRQLRDLCRYYVKLINYTTSEKNRFQNCLTVSGFKLDDVFSDVFGKSASKIVNQLLKHPGEYFDVAPYVHYRCKTPIETIQAAVDATFVPEQAQKLQIIESHMNCLRQLKSSLENMIFALAEKYKDLVDLILTVPGIADRLTAVRLLAEIGADMSVFESSKHLCSWAGLVPQNNESAGKKKTTRIGKAGVYIKPLLFQCAHALSLSKKHPEITSRFNQIKKRRGHKKAVVAVARRLLTAICHMLKKKEPYNPDLYKAEKAPDNRVLSVEQALALLKSKGYVISEPSPVPSSG